MKKGFVFLETIIVLTVVTLSLTILLTSYTLITTKAKEKENYDKVSDKYLLYTFSNLGTNATYNYKTISDKGYLKISPNSCEDDQLDSSNASNIFTIKNGIKTYIDPAGTPARECLIKDASDNLILRKDNNPNDNANPYSHCDFFHIFNPAMQNDVMIDTSYSTGIEEDDTCKVVLNKLGIRYLYIIPNIQEVLKSKHATSIYDPGTLNYIKTLKKCYDTNVYTKEDENGNIVVNNNVTECNKPVKYMVGVFYRNGEYYFASIEL